jgi:DNA-binding winged helix-turn-helix (wHTH) protein
MEDRLGGRLCFVFGGFRLDANRRVIEAPPADRRLVLPPRIFDAAHYFVRHPGQLLSKERLLAELWPGMVVEENSLTQVISMLRRALGESRGDNRFIVTVPRRGYRFVADVVRVAGGARERTAFSCTVQVLQFDNWSTLYDDERLAVGIAESIRHRLAGVGGLRLFMPVVSSHSREGERRKGLNLRVEGSLQRVGARLRITARLVDAADDTLVWSQLFDRTNEDIFAVEDKVARRVACALRQSLAARAQQAAGS